MRLGNKKIYLNLMTNPVVVIQIYQYNIYIQMHVCIPVI